MPKSHTYEIPILKRLAFRTARERQYLLDTVLWSVRVHATGASLIVRGVSIVNGQALGTEIAL